MFETIEMNRGRRLRELFTSGEAVLMPGVGCALHAKLAESGGYDAVHLSGELVAMYTGNFPDIGVLTMTEVATVAAYVAGAVSVPVFADADTGFGHAAAVVRTVERFIRAGVAGMHLEDQADFPKRLPHSRELVVLPLDDALGKLRAALDTRARLDPEFVIVARTDALEAQDGGLDEVLRRVAAFHDLGVDGVFVPGVSTREEFEAIRDAGGLPHITAFSMYKTVEPRPRTPQDLAELGIGGVIAPDTLGAQSIIDFQHRLRERREQGLDWEFAFAETTADEPGGTFASRMSITGIDRYRDLERRYSPGLAKRANDAGV